MRVRKVSLALFIVTCVALLATSAVTVLRGSQQNGSSNKPQRSIDLERWPIADRDAPEPSDPDSRAKRRSRNKKYDKSEWPIHADDISDSTVRVDWVNPELSAFPAEKSDVVVIGTIANAASCLSNDKTGVYSEFAVCIEEILKNNLPRRLATGGMIDVQREGGRVRFPSGRVHWYSVAKQDMPQSGGRYVLFLAASGEESALTIVTGYELEAGRVFPLDDLPKLDAYKGADTLTFLRELRAALSATR